MNNDNPDLVLDEEDQAFLEWRAQRGSGQLADKPAVIEINAEQAEEYDRETLAARMI